jgi:hypothetical protein
MCEHRDEKAKSLSLSLEVNRAEERKKQQQTHEEGDE